MPRAAARHALSFQADVFMQLVERWASSAIAPLLKAIREGSVPQVDRFSDSASVAQEMVTKPFNRV